MKLNGFTVTIGITGGIAVYKMCDAVASLKKAGADVRVVMTKNAARFVSPLTFETLSGNRVVSDMFDRDYEWEVEHISLAKKSNIMVIAPATLNFVGKFAAGIADDFLTTTVTAAKCPVLICPAMNTNMLESEAYLDNVALLKKRGVLFLDSDEGYLACGDVGKGRLAPIEQIIGKITEILLPKCDYTGKTVMVTAGGTIERIDPVRYISNFSSGKMGYALARAAYLRGAKVIFIKAHTDPMTFPSEWEVVDVISTQDMMQAVATRLPQADYIIKAAAPADYRVENPEAQKIKSESLNLKLTKNPDIAAYVGGIKGDKKLVIFSAETQNLIENAKGKLQRKNADMVVANDVTKEGAGFNGETNIASIITKKRQQDLPIMSKAALAGVILDELIKL